MKFDFEYIIIFFYNIAPLKPFAEFRFLTNCVKKIKRKKTILVLRYSLPLYNSRNLSLRQAAWISDFNINLLV